MMCLHSVRRISSKLQGLRAIIAHTIMAKGLSLAENNVSFHDVRDGRPEQALFDLKGRGGMSC